MVLPLRWMWERWGKRALRLLLPTLRCYQMDRKFFKSTPDKNAPPFSQAFRWFRGTRCIPTYFYTKWQIALGKDPKAKIRARTVALQSNSASLQAYLFVKMFIDKYDAIGNKSSPYLISRNVLCGPARSNQNKSQTIYQEKSGDISSFFSVSLQKGFKLSRFVTWGQGNQWGHIISDLST